MNLIKLTTPLSPEALTGLHAGDSVLISGTIYTARDAAHRQMMKAIIAGEKLPFELQGAVIYYCGPAPAPPGWAIGAAGPTTSYRMDSFTPHLHELGLAASIGKGDRTMAVREACRKYKSVYFVAVGGAGALLAKHITASRVIAYDDLGPEAVHELQVSDFPVIVAYDVFGHSVFPSDKPLPDTPC